MILREGDRLGLGADRVESAIDVAGEGADRRARLGAGETLETLVIEVGQRGRNVHQLGQPIGPNLRRRQRRS